VRRASVADLKAVSATLADGFYDDPMMGWLLPDPNARLGQATRLFEAFVRPVLRYDLVYTTTDLVAAAVWSPPGHWRTSILDQLRTMPTLVSVLRRRTAAAGTLFSAIEKAHPEAPHYYLSILATRRTHQGQSIGSELLRPVLERCDGERMPAFLESSNPQNIPFYERQGFVVTRRLDHLPGGAPLLTQMWRDPRS
jgi:ribosomal protein S18 acetylase RimI-like enzyme